MMQSRPKRIRVSAGDRWAIIGASGTGKTTFAISLLRNLIGLYPAVPVHILNTKPDELIARLGHVDEGNDVPRLGRHAVQIWQPLDDDQKQYHQYFEALRKQPGPLIFYCDELSNIGGASGSSFPLGYTRMLKQARGLHKTMITGSQELAYIPRQVLGQTTHLIGFRVENDYDQRILKDKMKVDELAIPHPHGFFYRRLDAIHSGVYYPGASLFF